MSEPLFPSLADPDDREAIRIGDDAITYRDLARAAAATTHELEGAKRVAVWAEPTLELAVATVAALAAGVAAVPINPGLGSRELGHIVSDSAPERLLAWPGVDPPERLQQLPRTDVDRSAAGSGGTLPDELGDDDTAFVMYTSGTTGPPKGVQIPRRAIATNLDA
ncbi:MAG TPA: AMP-binding protein, partial [Gaiellaceae bacterium]|nr:AMP-binding protein [Gaiellaceae bacterium]